MQTRDSAERTFAGTPVILDLDISTRAVADLGADDEDAFGKSTATMCAHVRAPARKTVFPAEAPFQVLRPDMGNDVMTLLREAADAWPHT